MLNTFFCLFVLLFQASGLVASFTSLFQLAVDLLDCEQSLFCSKIPRENERDGMCDIRAASGEAASRK